MALQEGYGLAQQLQAAVEKGKLQDASTLLNKLKVLLTQFESLPPLHANTPSAQQERLLGRSVLESAVFLSIKLEDKTMFQRQIAQLKPYYMDYGSSLPKSEVHGTILGLNLLYLLVENRLAEFHSELEHLSDQERADPCISFPIQLEQSLMVGSYDKVLASQMHTPHAAYGLFMSLLVDTVRDLVADCTEVAYRHLSLSAAKRSMLFESDAALQKYIQDKHPDWQVVGNNIHFGKIVDHRQAKATDVPTMRLIAESLSYATELERIV